MSEQDVGFRRRRRRARVAASALLGNGRKAARATAMAVLSLGVIVSGMIVPATAQAQTVYEITGGWNPGTPTTVSKGDNVTSVWRFNINDDAPAPANDPVDNVTVTFTAQNGKFTAIPDGCLTVPEDPAVPLAPVSEIQNGGATLVCNIGTRDQGTAELMLTGLEVTGDSGDAVSIGGEIGGQTASPPPLPIFNPFAMDMKFDGGAESRRNGTLQEVFFPWSLRHAPGAEAGPNSVSYTLTFTNTSGSNLRVFTSNPCVPLTEARAEHPYSDAAHAADRTAPFPGTCTLTRIGTTNQFTLTISGIDYSKSQVPTTSATGQSLETDWDVVAAGELRLFFTYEQPGQVTFTASAPTYAGAVTGATSQDLADNNSNSLATSRGTWTGGWVLRSVGLPGTNWTDTSRAGRGDLVRAHSGIRAPDAAGEITATCTVLDTKYVDFVGVQTGTVNDTTGTVTPYPGSGDIRYWYYVGTGTNNNVNPAHANYNPNTFTCETGWGSTDWVSTPPANLSRVKAVREVIPFSAAAGISTGSRDGIARSYVDSRIKANVSIGQDIWTWTSYNFTGNGTTGWQNPQRTMNANDVPPSGVTTPGTRYPYAGAGRDILRVVSARPQVTKQADQATTMPGGTVQYTVTYRAQSAIDGMPIDDFTLSDVLPAGMTYVPGSASIQPSSVSGQTLTWNLPDVVTNTEYVLTYSALMPDDASPGQTFTNAVTATTSGQSATASDTVGIRDGGYVQLTKTAAAHKVPHDGGVADNSWTVRLTSHDSQANAWTDTIDVLPYNGDGRGTDFAGSYRLSGPVQAGAGATVYYTTAPSATLNDDPNHATNGAANAPSAIWSTTYTANATGVRVIGPQLAAGAQQEFTVSVVTSGATPEDRYVNRAEARSARQLLKTRTSDAFEIGAVNSVTIKKYVQDSDDAWHDAQDIDDYPAYHSGDTVPYRLVVTNTGDEPLQNLEIDDDRVDLAGIDPLPAGLTLVGGKAVIAELLPGEANQVVIEYPVTLAAGTPAGSLVNNACVVPEVVDPDDPDAPSVGAEPDCDPAGITLLPSSLAWEKIAAGTPDVERLAGSEWELTPVDADDEPTSGPISVVDCVEAVAADCDGPDVDPGAGRFTIDPLEDGRYRLVETRAPAGYRLDPTPHYIDVLGPTAFDAPIENELQEGPSMPLTGGMGTFGIFLGAGVTGGLAVLLVLLRRRSRRLRGA